MTSILLCTPFKNEDHAVEKYVEGLLNLNSSKEFIDVVWLENDSVDRTWEMLQENARKVKRRFHSLRLLRKSYNMMFQKNPPGSYWKEQWISQEKRARIVIDIYRTFFRMIEGHDYFLMYMADAVPPPNVIEKYLSVFESRPDAGWVGGVLHRRFPLHQQLESPVNLNYQVYTERALPRDAVIRCGFTGHVFMIKSNIITKEGCNVFYYPREIVVPFVKCLRNAGFEVYCDTSVYIKHISTDGKIYRDGLS